MKDITQKRTVQAKKRTSSRVGKRQNSFTRKIYRRLQICCLSVKDDFLRIYFSIVDDCLNVFKHCFPRLWRKIKGYEHIQNGSFDDFSESSRQAILPKDVLGHEGERIVFDYIKEKPGCEIVACNAENYYCELDIIYLDKTNRQIVFVEVKTRRHDYIKYPAFRAVDAKRRKKMALAAELFVKERGYFQYSKRFDVAVVVYPLNAEPVIKYHKNAFTFKYALVGYKKDDFGKTRRKKAIKPDYSKASK